MVTIVMQKLELEIEILIELLNRLPNPEEQLKFLTFLIQYELEHNNSHRFNKLIKWCLETNRQIFDQYFGIKDGIIPTPKPIRQAATFLKENLFDYLADH